MKETTPWRFEEVDWSRKKESEMALRPCKSSQLLVDHDVEFNRTTDPRTILPENRDAEAQYQRNFCMLSL